MLLTSLPSLRCQHSWGADRIGWPSWNHLDWSLHPASYLLPPDGSQALQLSFISAFMQNFAISLAHDGYWPTEKIWLRNWICCSNFYFYFSSISNKNLSIHRFFSPSFRLCQIIVSLFIQMFTLTTFLFYFKVIVLMTNPYFPTIQRNVNSSIHVKLRMGS